MPTADAKAKTTKVDTARATAKQIKAELQAVTKQLQAQQAKSVSARQAASAAVSRLKRAQEEEAAIDARLDQVRSSAKNLAIRAYTHGKSEDGIMLADADIAEITRARYLRSVALGSATDLKDSLRSAQQDKSAARKAAESAARTAAERNRTVANALRALEQSRNRQLELAGAAEARLEAAVKESEAAARLGARGSRGNSRRGSVSLTTVHGITVASSIAGRLDSMLNAAEADGRRFGGSGYRSSDGQVAARKRNCGTSDYAVYDMPSSRCRPPTAKPGQSMHEQGLAIDFTYNGSLIQSRSSDGFKWLKANAARFGFYNLPSEAWHWSVNGN